MVFDCGRVGPFNVVKTRWIRPRDASECRFEPRIVPQKSRTAVRRLTQGLLLGLESKDRTIGHENPVVWTIIGMVR